MWFWLNTIIGGMKDVKSNTGLFPLENITTGKKYRIKLIYIYFSPKFKLTTDRHNYPEVNREKLDENYDILSEKRWINFFLRCDNSLDHLSRKFGINVVKQPLVGC